MQKQILYSILISVSLQLACGRYDSHTASPGYGLLSGPNPDQTEIHVGVVGDSISQGSFGETNLGAPFPKNYARFYDRHLHLLAQLKFAPSTSVRMQIGQIMGKAYRDFWYSHSFVANREWGLYAKFQQLHPRAQIRVHSEALMAATSASVRYQIQALLDTGTNLDYFFFEIGTNDVCSSEYVSLRQFRANLVEAFREIRSQSTAPIIVLEVSPLHKVAAATDENGDPILDRMIDYREFRQHFGLSSLVARLGLMPRDCREHIKLECPAGIDMINLKNVIDDFNAELVAATEMFSNIRIVRFDPRIEIKPQDLAVDCFHPNLAGQRKFFEGIDLGL